MFSGIQVLILAAGSSRRMGTPKMLLPAPEGNLLKQTASRVLAAGPFPVAVITDEQGPVGQTALGDLPVEWLETDQASFGLGSTLAAGITMLSERRSPQGIMVLLGDEPLIDPALIRRVAEQYLLNRAAIVQVRYTDRAAHPVLFDAALFPELQNLSGDTGARVLLQKYKSQTVYVAADCRAPGDIDTPEEYREYIRVATGQE